MPSGEEDAMRQQASWGPVPDADAAVSAVWAALTGVRDPEIPVLSVVELGIVRDVRRDGEGRLEVTVTPTYSGCPATGVIAFDIRRALDGAGFPDARLSVAIAPPWTTDWISDSGRAKLREIGIAPPPHAGKRALVAPDETVACPRCGSADTELISRFGSTACKALHRCRDCLEPFDSFKCI
jgi:ring-1,2-phenylacetyl-CoA epoxidase subunit PaaD